MYVECVEIADFRRKEGVFRMDRDSDPGENAVQSKVLEEVLLLSLVQLTIFGWLDGAKRMSVRFGKSIYQMTEHPQGSGNWVVTVKVKPATPYTWNLVEGDSKNMIEDIVMHSIEPFNEGITKAVIHATWGEDGITSSYKSADREFPAWNPPNEKTPWSFVSFITFLTHYVVHNANHVISVDAEVMDKAEKIQAIAGEEVQPNTWLTTLRVPKGSELSWSLTVLDIDGVQRQDTNKHVFTVHEEWTLIKSPWAHPYEVLSVDDKAESDKAIVDSGISSESSVNALLGEENGKTKAYEATKTEVLSVDDKAGADKATVDSGISSESSVNSSLGESDETTKVDDVTKNDEIMTTDEVMKNDEIMITDEVMKNDKIMTTNEFMKNDEIITTDEVMKPDNSEITKIPEGDMPAEAAKKSTLLKCISARFKTSKKNRAKKESIEQKSRKPKGGFFNRIKKSIVSAFRCGSGNDTTE